jgi:uncharacterized membrane protein YgcG
MKKISVFLGLLTLLFTGLALAQGAAVVTTVTGSAQVQTGSATPRTLRLGDEVRQGDTVSTGANSSLVLKFDDGEVAALTQNSRMTITAYQYQPEARTGNVLLSLINGGMRAITGLIGRSQPERVAYRAATTTIGIRGTDIDVATDGTNVAVTVNDGVITFTYQGQTVTLTAGQGAFTSNGQIRPGAAAEILRQLPPDMRGAIGGLDGLVSAINAAGVGQPRDGGNEGQGVGQGSAGANGGPTVGGGNSGGGGGSSSQH